jgi:hypothetical protein
MYPITTCTYIINIKGTNKYKIGKSKNPKRRLKQFQTASPVTLILVIAVKSDKWLEGRLHKMFM